MSNKNNLEVNKMNNKEIYPPFFPEHFFLKEQPKNNINYSQIKNNQSNFLNIRVKSNRQNNNMFFIKKF